MLRTKRKWRQIWKPIEPINLRKMTGYGASSSILFINSYLLPPYQKLNIFINMHQNKNNSHIFKTEKFNVWAESCLWLNIDYTRSRTGINKRKSFVKTSDPERHPNDREQRVLLQASFETQSPGLRRATTASWWPTGQHQSILMIIIINIIILTFITGWSPLSRNINNSLISTPTPQTSPFKRWRRPLSEWRRRYIQTCITQGGCRGYTSHNIPRISLNQSYKF